MKYSVHYELNSISMSANFDELQGAKVFAKWVADFHGLDQVSVEKHHEGSFDCATGYFSGVHEVIDVISAFRESV